MRHTPLTSSVSGLVSSLVSRLASSRLESFTTTYLKLLFSFFIHQSISHQTPTGFCPLYVTSLCRQPTLLAKVPTLPRYSGIYYLRYKVVPSTSTS